MFFGSRPKPANFARTLIGEWRADTMSGGVRGEITAIFHADGSYMTRHRMEVRGVLQDPVAQTGRFRIEPVDRQRFRLLTIDDNGHPVSASVRTFTDQNTMVNEVGRITFKRISPSMAAIK